MGIPPIEVVTPEEIFVPPMTRLSISKEMI